MDLRHINYKSDFVVRERFRNAAGDVVALPDVDFELCYWTNNPDDRYTARRDGGVMTNCVADGDAVLVMLQHHGLAEGELHHELHLKLDNPMFGDGVQNVYYPEHMQIWLWAGASDTEGVLESDVMAAYTRGLRFTIDDFTDEQLQQLSQPALDAVEAEKRSMSQLLDAMREAAARADEAGQRVDGEAQRLESVRVLMEEATARALAAAADVPTGLRLQYPQKVTLGNSVAQYIVATVLPVSARQNTLFLADGAACEVDPDGRIMPKHAGRSRVHVVPTGGTEHYKTIEIEIVVPAMRLTGRGLRLDGSGNIRLT